MAQIDTLAHYQHAHTTVDGVLLRYAVTDKRLQACLVRRSEVPEQGKWGLPGGFLDVDRRLDETLRNKFYEKTGVKGFYIEQLKTFDRIDRDPRARVLSVAYLALTNRFDAGGDWFELRDGGLRRGEEVLAFEDLAFDHGEILREALARLKGKIWYTDLLRFLLPEEFIIREAQTLVELIEGKPVLNFRRTIAGRITDTGRIRTDTNGRPAATFVWNTEECC